MSELSREMVEYVADLARLRLSDEQLSWYQGQLSRIVSYVERLDQLDDRLANMADGPDGLPALEREDKVRADFDVDLALNQAPKTVGTAFQVPKIIE
jgi:aspartyl-tRNA(Asn)/glutamyl-tRNA(Gln) amidotransferase subunit C